MSRTPLMMALILVACSQAESPRPEPTGGAPTRQQAAQLAAATPAPIPPEYAARIVAQAGPACRTFLRCCEDTAARLPGIRVDCASVAAQGEQTCSQALDNYSRAPASLQARMPASCTGGVRP